MTSKPISTLTAAAVIAAAIGVWAQGSNRARNQIAPGDWPNLNRDLAATRFSPLTQINTSNVGSLRQAWTYRLGGGATSVPLVVGGVMFASSGPRVVALDADTGSELWSFAVPAAPAAPPPPVSDAQAPAAAAPPPGLTPAGGGRRGGGPPVPAASQRGVGYWPGDGETSARVMFLSGTRLFAVDAATGKPSAGFGSNGVVDIGVPYSGTPTLYRNVVIIGANVNEVPQGPPGNPRAFDAKTGKKLWEFQTVPKPGAKFNDTWGDGWKERSGTNMWGFAAPVDIERGIVYLPISGPAANYYGGDRPGRNDFANSVVAVDAQTGKYLWHFQTVHHDRWE